MDLDKQNEHSIDLSENQIRCLLKVGERLLTTVNLPNYENLAVKHLQAELLGMDIPSLIKSD